METSGRTLRLTVADAALGDVTTGRARLSRHLFEALDLEAGDLIRIQRPDPGARAILATVVPAEDEGLDLVRIDGAQRRRAGVRVGDVVEVERHQLPAASFVRVMTVGTLSD